MSKFAKAIAKNGSGLYQAITHHHNRSNIRGRRQRASGFPVTREQLSWTCNDLICVYLCMEFPCVFFSLLFVRRRLSCVVCMGTIASSHGDGSWSWSRGTGSGWGVYVRKMRQSLESCLLVVSCPNLLNSST